MFPKFLLTMTTSFDNDEKLFPINERTLTRRVFKNILGWMDFCVDERHVIRCCVHVSQEKTYVVCFLKNFEKEE
jgi:hypothetical protein